MYTDAKKDILDFLDLIHQLYQRSDIYLASVPPETGYFLHSLIRLTKPDVVVEIGTYKGVSSLWMARALKENNKGHLYTIDIYEHSSPEEPRGLLKGAELLDFVSLIDAPSVPNGLKICRQMQLSVDILFIDGDHRIEPCAADFLGFWKIVKKGGLILLHDTNLESGWEGPRFILDCLESKVNEKYTYKYIELLKKGEAGLSLIQKTEDSPPRIIPYLAYLIYLLRTKFRFWWKRS